MGANHTRANQLAEHHFLPQQEPQGGIHMRELGVGVVGCGSISDTYLRNIPLFEGLRLRACSDQHPEVAAEQAARFEIEALDSDALLRRDDIDIVVNLTVPNAHFVVSHAALTAGKHVYSEKPLAVALQDGRRLVAEAEARGLALGCAPDSFLGAGGRLARRIVDDGRVGRILAGTACIMSHGMEHWHPDPEFYYQPGGGPILDLGPYYLTALVNLLGPVARVQAHGSIGLPERILTAEGPRQGQRIRVATPTTVMALLEFAAGARVSLTASWEVWKHSHPVIELYGTEGSMRVPDPNVFGATVDYTERDGDWQVVDSSPAPFGRPNWHSRAWPASRPPQANYRGIGLAELASAVMQGTPHRSSGRLALHVLETMHAILEAAETGGTVAVGSPVERPPVLTEDDARAFARPGAL
jgi:predicted dehydrogenase